MTKKETGEYIVKRLKIAGRRASLFTKGAVKEIYRKTNGIPRLVNVLCDNALLIGYASDKKLIDKKIVAEAARDMKSGWIPPHLWKWLIPGIAVAGGVLSLVVWQGEKASFGRDLLHALQSAREIIENGLKTILKWA